MDDEPSPAPNPSQRRTAKPHATLFRLGLQPLIVHFKSIGNGYMDPATMESFDNKILKRIVSDTARQAEVREQLGSDQNVWKDLQELFEASVNCLTESCFHCPKPNGSTSEEPEIASSALIVTNHATLVKDLARLNGLVSIGRNILTIGDVAQNLAASMQVDLSLFKLVTLCIKITARGFDSGGTKEDEKKWQAVVNDYKKLLVTCLQFLNNLVAQNERRKLMLWVELFDSPTDANGSGPALDRRFMDSFRDDPALNTLSSAVRGTEDDMRDGIPHVIRRFKDGLLAHMNRLDERRPPGKSPAKEPVLDKEHLSSSPFLLYIGKVGMDIKKELHDAGKPAGATEIAAECKRRWQNMTKDEQRSWHNYYSELLARYRDELDATAIAPKNGEPKTNEDSVVALARGVEQIQSDIRSLRISVSARLDGDPNVVDPVLMDGSMDLDAHINFGENIPILENLPKSSTLEQAPAADTDYRVTYTADYGATILQQGKEDLLRRLEPDSDRPSRPRRTRTRSPPPPTLAAAPTTNPPIPDPPDAPLALASEDEREPLSEEEESEYDDPEAGDDGRGLLTDVPLILGPVEIEVLPMIIQSGIVPPGLHQPGYGTSKEEIAAIKNMHTVRCHLLLAQDNGRNLLRELLIFVAAWDLREEELYFKLMTQIIEAVLTNGLLPFSYHAFREPKDIISPAQAVIMKLLTNIFRTRQAETARRTGLTVTPSRAPRETVPKMQTYPQRVDVHMVSFLFTEFRRHIIPQTCALIFLQGQIRNGTVSPEEFPLNLWDMERMYEGIYQYLEFFAILTEHDVWKRMMAEWEITSELVTLLEELDVAIPRSTPKQQKPDHKQRATSKALIPPFHDVEKQPVAVERPYDTTAGAAPSEAVSPTPIPPPEDEPSDFEWRNLKKLAVLVLSSLVWKSRAVQAQLGAADPRNSLKGRGIRALLNCCKIDDYNPFIREHAIMALRFALEGNLENQDVVRQLEKMEGMANGNANVAGDGEEVRVPREVLDLNGYETFVDGRGQVQLKKRGESSGSSMTPTGAGQSRKGKHEVVL